MIIVNEDYLQEEYIGPDEKEYVIFKDSKTKQVKAVFPIITDSNELADTMENLKQVKLPSEYLPTDQYELEAMLRYSYTRMVQAFIVDLSINYIVDNYDLPEDFNEDLKNYSDALLETYNGLAKQLAEMHPLWMKREYKGMKYYGGNPYNMYPSERYATSDMYDRIIPERKNIIGLAFGAYNFSVEDASKGCVGIEKIEEINRAVNPPQNDNE